MTYKEHNIKEIKKHLRKLLKVDYEKLNELDLITIEHILYYHLIQDLTKCCKQDFEEKKKCCKKED